MSDVTSSRPNSPTGFSDLEISNGNLHESQHGELIELMLRHICGAPNDFGFFSLNDGGGSRTLTSGDDVAFPYRPRPFANTVTIGLIIDGTTDNTMEIEVKVAGSTANFNALLSEDDRDIFWVSMFEGVHGGTADTWYTGVPTTATEIRITNNGPDTFKLIAVVLKTGHTRNLTHG